MQSTIVIGYGNPLHKDDGLGWRVIECLGCDSEFDKVNLHACHQLTPELAAAICRLERVIFVDASSAASAGDLFCNEVTAESGTACYTHSLTPPTLLALAQDLYGMCPRAWIVGLGGESFDLGEGLSSTVSAAVPQLIEKISELCQ